MHRSLAAGAAAVGIGALAVAAGSAGPPQASTTLLRAHIKHVIVIYQENWSFDGLYGSGNYGSFLHVEGLSHLTPAQYAQVDKNGAPVTTLPQPLNGLHSPDPDFAGVKGKPVGPYEARPYVGVARLTGDLVHKFYHEQSQIDGGKMDKFMAWSDNPGLVLSHFDASTLPEGRLADRYTLSDRTFHSAFGSSFLNHQWLICACTPTFPSPPPAMVAAVDATGKQLLLDANGKIVHDGPVTPDGYVVNTAFSVYAPHPASSPEYLVPPQSNPTIGDRLEAANVDWRWYSGGWDDALAGNPSPDFQYHHQPFAYFERYGDGTPAKAKHLKDENLFLGDLRAHRLAPVSFIKPLGRNNEHPGYSALAAGQAHVASLVQAIQRSSYWNDTLIIITYDENGGRWDHVAPPGPFDRWGPGTRVPTILISPWVKRHFVDHTQYETVSVLALIEQLYGLQPLTSRDAAANPFSNAFDFSQRG